MGCPACSYRVTGSESACPRCGKRFDKTTRFECPFCGSQISKKAKRCPSCQIDLVSIQVRHEPLASGLKTGALEAKPLGDDGRRFVCPGCSAALAGTEQECPTCGRAVSGKLGLQCPLCGTSVDLEFRECPICGISLETVLKKAGQTVHVGLANTRPCPFCGAIIPLGLENCPLCLTNLAEPPVQATPATATEPEPVKPAPPIAQPIVEEEISHGPGKISPPAAKQAKVRRVKAKVTTVPPPMQTGAVRGRTNGVGQINGLGKVNGTGAVNGKAFVNGTGLQQATGTRPSREVRNKSFITKWHLLVVLVALIIVLPTLMYFSFSNESGKFKVDGNFEEWSGVRTLGTRVWSASSSSNITEWAVATESSDLYLYIETGAGIMKSPDPVSFFLFVDSDASKATGYVVESIGADYMLKIVGWNSTINTASLSRYTSPDQYDWNAWTSAGAASCRPDGARLEAGVTMPVPIGDNARFILVSKDSADRGSVSCTAPLKGGVLVIEQSLASTVSGDVVPLAASVSFLHLELTSYGSGGRVEGIAPTIVNAKLAGNIQPISLAQGSSRELNVQVDTTGMVNGQFVSAVIDPSGVQSNFTTVEIVGPGAKAYVVAPSPTIEIDGAFADWVGKVSVDEDPTQVSDKSLDIVAVGNVSDVQNTYFYVGVADDMCGGDFVPIMLGKATVTGGGIVVPPRRTAEDILNIYVDSDKSNLTGKIVTLASKRIGADHMIQVKGLFGTITSANEYDYVASSDSWTATSGAVDAAKDDRRIEIAVSAASLQDSTDVDFIVETTSWRGRSDLATFDPSHTSAFTRTWVVDPSATSPYATSMSYQRKMFFDGVNFWSFYFDGTDTVYKYSADCGLNWNYCGPIFSTPGVNETSIWFDEPTRTAYAVGDTSTATCNVTIQAGSVDPSAHAITWASSDSQANVSRMPMPGKNTYICKDTNAYLWILSSNCLQIGPTTYQLSAYQSTRVNDTRNWTFSSDMLGVQVTANNIKGCIVPAGTGSDVWAVYAWGGNVASKKYAGAWQPQQIIYAQVGSKAGTDNAPPSVVVDGKGVVHVVYGTGRRSGSASVPVIEWSHNLTDQIGFTPGLAIDIIPVPTLGDFYPTISLDSLTGDLYALWLRGSNPISSSTVMGKKYASNTWTNLTIDQQTVFPKMFLTSVYSVRGANNISWQWTENVTAPVYVMFDGLMIPEFSHMSIPLVLFATVFAAFSYSRRRKRIDS